MTTPSLTIHESAVSATPELGKYSHLSTNELIIMIIAAVLTNLSVLPALRIVRSDPRSQFPAWIYSGGLACSILYHLCEALNWRLFLEEGEWHRLDNIFVIASFQLLLLHLISCPSPGSPHTLGLQYLSLFSSVVIQEPYPWNPIFTVGPIICYGFLIIGLRTTGYFPHAPRYDFKFISISIVSLMISIIAFAKGLDEHTDYLRLWHGLWHLSGGGIGYGILRGVTEGRGITRDGDQETQKLLKQDASLENKPKDTSFQNN